MNNDQSALRESDTQPMPGWGFICATCQHTFSDDKKYTPFPPGFPCNKLKWICRGPVFELVRFTDGSEKCPHYEAVPVAELASP